MPNSPFHSQVEQNIQTLLVEKKYREAYELCIELIKKYPSERSYLKLKEKIEKEVEKENDKKIKEKIEELKPLWKEEKYGDIIRELYKILQINKNNQEAQELYNKAQRAYREQMEGLQSQFEKKQRTELDELLNKSPDALIGELYQLEKSNPNNRLVKELVHEYRSKAIQKKIDANKALLESEKYLDIESFINQLRKIEEKNSIIDQLVQKIEKRKSNIQYENEREYLYESKENIQNLLKLKKYDKALKAVEELMDKFPEEKSLKSLREKCSKHFYAQNKITTIQSIEEKQAQLKEEFSKDKESFIKL